MDFRNLLKFFKRYTVAHAVVAGGFFASGYFLNTNLVYGILGFLASALVMGLLSPGRSE